MTRYRRLGRISSHRMAMLKNLTLSLFKNGKITTTHTRALEMRRIAEKMITFAKRGDLHARRQVIACIGDQKEVKRLFEETAPKYQDRNGGYTRIYKVGFRRGDNAPMVVIELV